MKKIVLLFFIFIITGCSVKYDLIINEDLTITETASLTGTSEFFDNYYKTTKKNVLKSLLDIYQDILVENKYEYELKEDNAIPYVLVSKKYNNANEYTEESILFNDYFDDVKYSEDGNIKRIETIGFKPNELDNPDRFNVKLLIISIKCPYEVINHTAIDVDSSTNTFYYELDSEHDKILIEYDTSQRFNPNKDLVRTIIICILVIIAAWITVVYLNKKNNKK